MSDQTSHQAISRCDQQRPGKLTECEKVIKKHAAEFVAVGNALKEIRDDELWREVPGCDGWVDYLNNRVADHFGIARTQSNNLINAAEVASKLDPVVSGSFTSRVVTELSRLAPKESHRGNKPSYNFAKLRKRDVQRVVKKAQLMAEETGKEKITAAIVRKCVDDELGIDRAAKAREARAEEKRRVERWERQEREHQDRMNSLPTVLVNKQFELRKLLEQLQEVPPEGWHFLHKEKGYVATQLSQVCRELAEFLDQTKPKKPAPKESTIGQPMIA